MRSGMCSASACWLGPIWSMWGGCEEVGEVMAQVGGDPKADISGAAMFRP
jgi:hypothetical protein